ncbi:MAG: DUF2202 domain-containing protein [Fimbriimonadaceae bacterium]
MITTIILAAALTQLAPAEVDLLTYMRQEEKLALDVYNTLGKAHLMRIFQNIARAEAAHTESVRQLLIEFKLPDPNRDLTPGKFKNQELQKLHDDLVTKGKKSLNDALNVGATIEDKDIFDINKSMTETKNQKILTVLNELKRGSENHMRAFYRQLKNRNITYRPQFIKQAELDKIIG